MDYIEDIIRNIKVDLKLKGNFLNISFNPSNREYTISIFVPNSQTPVSSSSRSLKLAFYDLNKKIKIVKKYI